MQVFTSLKDHLILTFCKYRFLNTLSKSLFNVESQNLVTMARKVVESTRSTVNDRQQVQEQVNMQLPQISVLLETAVFRSMQNFEPSRGNCPFPQNFYVFTEICRIRYWTLSVVICDFLTV